MQMKKLALFIGLAVGISAASPLQAADAQPPQEISDTADTADTGCTGQEDMADEDQSEDAGVSVNVISEDKAVTGWATVNRHRSYVDPETGEPVRDAWKTIDGKTYRFDGDGSCITGWYEEDGCTYFFDSQGVLKTGYVYVSPGRRMYFYPEGHERFGSYATGWQVINGLNCYFGEDGIITTGLEKVDGKTYHFGPDGAATTGWTESLGTRKYYYRETTRTRHIGEMATGFATIDGKLYYFSNSGAMQKGFFTVNGFTYYGGGDGVLRRGWVLTGGKKYYFWPDTKDGHYKGTAAKGWKKIDGSNYYFYPSGAMATGWTKINGFTYYYGEDGVQARGWRKIDGSTFYFFPETGGGHYSGTMATGFQKVNGFTYYFGSDGRQATGWTDIKKSVPLSSLKPFQVNTEGMTVSRTFRYYFWPKTEKGHYKGTGARGLVSIDGSKYLFADGLMQKNTAKTINGTRYVFGNDGTGRKAVSCRKGHSFDYGICTRCGTAVTPDLAVKEIKRMMSRYPSGSAWGDSSSYDARIDGKRETLTACDGFAYLLSDAAFKDLPVQYHGDLDRVRAGDMVTYRTGRRTLHTVIVLEVRRSSLVVAEGNNNGRVVWNRVLTKASLKTSLEHVKTRYIR